MIAGSGGVKPITFMPIAMIEECTIEQKLIY